MQDGFSCIWKPWQVSSLSLRHHIQRVSAESQTVSWVIRVHNRGSERSPLQWHRASSWEVGDKTAYSCGRSIEPFEEKQSGTERGFASVLSWSNGISWNRTETFVLDNIKWYIIKGQVFFGTDNTYATYCLSPAIRHSRSGGAIVPALQIVCWESDIRRSWKDNADL